MNTSLGVELGKTPTPSLPDSLIDRIFHYAKINPTHDALVSRNTTVSYVQLTELLIEQAEAFSNQGISQHSIVGINCADDIQHLVYCLAAIHIGATSCTIPSYEAQYQQDTLAALCQVTHIIDSDSITPEHPLSQRSPTVESTERAPPAGASLLFSTSGTTGDPKVVVHHDSDIVAQAHRHIESSRQRFVCLASIEHNFSKRHRLYALAVGATNVFFDRENDSIVTQCLNLAVDVIHVSAFQAQDLLAEKDIHKLSAIRLKLGGSHAPLTLRQQLRSEISTSLQAGYGTTETGAIAFTDPNDSGAGESVGQALPGIEICVVNPARKALKVGERGELSIRCKGMFRRYLAKPSLTAQRLNDGWFYTGDIGYLDQQQRIYLCGRSDDMFVFNSMNIFPQDLESAILKHPCISDAAVIPKASPVHGNIPVALLVFKKGSKQRLKDIQRFVHQQLGTRSPRQYIIVPGIPRTAAGKTSRSQTAKLPTTSSAIRGDILKLLEPKYLKNLRPSLVSDFKNGDQDIVLKDLAMDSLDRVSFLVALELEYNTVITPKELSTLRYLGNIVAHVLSPSLSDDEKIRSSSFRGSAGKRAMRDIDKPYIARFFQRLFHYCHTVVQLNNTLASLEPRLTPLDIGVLHELHTSDQLISKDAAEKFHIAIENWLSELNSMIQKSGKAVLEPFSLRKVSSTAHRFTGAGSPSEKTLLICFPPKHLRQLGIANAAFLQHIDSRKYDVLIISKSFETGYQKGRSRFHNELSAFKDWFKSEQWAQQYGNIRTLGFSAGARTALALGHLLQAEMAVSVSGRFFRKRYIMENLDQFITIWKAARRNGCSQVLLSYTPDNRRDQRFAKVIAQIAKGRKVEIKHDHEKIKHLLFEQLLELGELGSLLDRTILAEQSDRANKNPSSDLSIHLPTGL